MSTMVKQDWNSEALEKIAEQALSHARAQGVTAAEVCISTGKGLSVTARKAEPETLEHYQDRSLVITVYRGQCKGSASTTDFSSQSIDEVVTAACSISQFTAEDAYAGLADAELMAKSVPDLELYHDWPLSAEDAIDLAKQCEASALEHNGISNSEGATVTRYSGYSLYANTHGFMQGAAGSRHSISCAVIAGTGTEMQRDYWYSAARNPDALESAEAVGAKAAARTLARVGARKINTERMPVLFSPEMARSLLGAFVSAVRGSAIYRQSSFLLDYKGKAVFQPFINITEQPHLLQALGSAAFDNEGVATQERDIICEGVLQEYVLDSYSARRLGLQTTGNAGGVRNLSIEAGTKNQSELLQEMQRGLLLTEMMGHGINLVTGDYSRGAAGFWVENGEIQYPVEEITVAGNLLEMFQNIKAVGNDIDQRGNIRTGSLLVDGMTVAGA